MRNEFRIMLIFVFFAVILCALPAAAIAQDETPPPAETISAEVPEPTPGGEPGSRPVGGLNRAKQVNLTTVAEKAARYPDNPYVLNEYANQLLKKGRMADAVAFYEKAVMLNPEFAQAWNNLGVAHQASRKFRDAVKAYRKALALTPNYALVHYNLGSNYDAMGRYKKAIRSYQRAFELQPSLLDIKVNPQIATNQHVTAVLLQTYVDRGGKAYFPVVSAYQKEP